PYIDPTRASRATRANDHPTRRSLPLDRAVQGTREHPKLNADLRGERREAEDERQRPGGEREDRSSGFAEQRIRRSPSNAKLLRERGNERQHVQRDEHQSAVENPRRELQ